MKKKLRLLLLVGLTAPLLPFQVVFAQHSPRDHTLKMSAGFNSVNPIRDYFGDFMGQVIAPVLYIWPGIKARTEITNRKYTPVLSLSYAYTLPANFQIGVSGSFERATGDFLIDEIYAGSFRRDYYALNAEAKYLFLDHATISLYCMAGLGYSWSAPQTNVPAHYHDFFMQKQQQESFHISPIGIRSGKALGVSAELGYGYKGLINGGIDFRF